MSDFSLINEVLRNPDALVQDETLWHATRVKQAIEQIPQGLHLFLLNNVRVVVDLFVG